MTDREKLIELLADHCDMKDKRCVGCKSGLPAASDCKTGRFGKVADHLIANGVVIKKYGRWIMRGGKLYCSACQQRACVARDSDDFWYTKGTDCCPNCGAVMDLEVEQ